ncbi:MAG: hypothetical protein IPK13_20205 [Deltaproteobacteria bacterium]|nr:hypothetical protein [Deltaproteobacteria bacterium]
MVIVDAILRASVVALALVCGGCSLLIDFRDGIPCRGDGDCDGYVCVDGACREPEPAPNPVNDPPMGGVTPADAGPSAATCSPIPEHWLCYDESCRSKCGTYFRYESGSLSTGGTAGGCTPALNERPDSARLVGTMRTWERKNSASDPDLCVYSIDLRGWECRELHVDCSDR